MSFPKAVILSALITFGVFLIRCIIYYISKLIWLIEWYYYYNKNRELLEYLEKFSEAILKLYDVACIKMLCENKSDPKIILKIIISQIYEGKIIYLDLSFISKYSRKSIRHTLEDILFRIHQQETLEITQKNIKLYKRRYSK